MTATAASAAQDRTKLLSDTERAQAAASDPMASVWVSANAGAGKTHVLKRRVLRILLSGTAPDRLLCLTYTKAAAAEMSGRIFNDLSAWATADRAALADALTGVLARVPSDDEMARARQLFARAIETPGGLKVQTIHAFCERVLQRFPLEADVSPGFTILDETEVVELLRSATDTVLTRAASDADSRLRGALHTAIAYAVGDDFDELLRQALSQRDWLEAAGRLQVGDSDGLAAMDGCYRRYLGVREGIDIQGLELEMAELLPPRVLTQAASALVAGGKTRDLKLAQSLTEAAQCPHAPHRVRALEAAFLTQSLEPRSQRAFVTKGVQQDHPDLYAALVAAKDRFAGLHLERRGLRVVEASTALIEIAYAVLQQYALAKTRRAALDFEDLITRTATLLAHSDAAQWVLYKLDGGLDHILVDEAQDTSPIQWRVIESLAQEFFSGLSARPGPRSVFAVGDEKQSIYSFQGAEPRMFDEAGDRFAPAVRAAGLNWDKVPLKLSFRTVAPLLHAVDQVFADAARTPGVAAPGEAIEHVALRIGQAGSVELWPTEQPNDESDLDAWQPYAETAERSPAVRLANRIADTIKWWLQTGETLVSQARPIRAGDVLILVRRRQPFAAPMVAALKARGIPVAGADRLRLTEQIAVLDLMALGDFLLLPEDDLALATVLRSPLFDWSDDDLLALAPNRAGTLWHALLHRADEQPHWQHAAAQLRRWRGRADRSPPFEFYAEVLDRDGVRQRLLRRLGPEAIDAITEFLNQALSYDAGQPPSLTGFLAWLRSGVREVSRDLEPGLDEVRVLTVHGAKGLEAPIVFLPDTCSTGAGRSATGLVELKADELADGRPPPLVWPVKGCSALPAIRAGKTVMDVAIGEERNRLLYVAMTRARDRLYVAGWEGKRARRADCWYNLIDSGLGELLRPAEDPQGRPVLRYQAPQTAPPEQEKPPGGQRDAASQPPAWAFAAAPREQRLALPLAPSQLAPYDIDDQGDPSDRGCDLGPHHPALPPEAPSPLRMAQDHRFLRGNLTHALLQHLPTLDPATWDEAATAFIEARATALRPVVRASIVTETLRLLRDDQFADVFGPASRAEVPIVAQIAPPGGRGVPLRLNGQIDRLVIEGDQILIIDYKTNRPPPSDPQQVAAAYVSQLAAYRMALAGIHPGRRIRAAILWTDGPRLMEIPLAQLQRQEAELWRMVGS